MRALVLAVVACGHPVETVPYAPEMRGSLDVYDGLQQRGGEIRIRWPSERPPPARGTRFVAIDRDGFVAILETTGAIDEHALRTRALTPLRQCRKCAVVGPTRAALDRARVVDPGRRPLEWFIRPDDPEWVLDRKLDLDGDGHGDLDVRRRCAQTTGWGCSDQVCERICFAIPGHSEHCHDQDIDDHGHCGDD
jgi:hypothetical protein